MGTFETLLMILGGITLTILIIFIAMWLIDTFFCEHEWSFEGTNSNKTSLIFVCRKCNKSKAMKVRYDQFARVCRDMEVWHGR